MRAWYFGLVLFVLGVSRSGAAHDLALDQLILQPDFGHALLRGQVTYNPHRTRQKRAEPPERTSARVVASLEHSLRLEIDGQPCRPKYEVRELWVPAGATVGDIVLLSCELLRPPSELRVFISAPLEALIVSVEATDAQGANSSQSVMITRDTWTPPYHFSAESPTWRAGGATQFEPGGAAVQPTPSGSAPVASDAAPSPAPALTSARPLPTAPTGFGAVGLGAQARRYFVLGFEHILPGGWDHVLFVAGLVLGAGLAWRQLLWQLSAFTVAHTLTLGLGALGWVVLPRGFVEPFIAFSIAFVAVENLRSGARSGGAWRYRPLIVFGFGLLHGQGFAGALAETGLPRQAFLVSLLSFNAGVEVGQLLVVGALLALLSRFKHPEQLQRWVARPGSVLIALMGLAWGIQRLFG